MFTVEVCTLQFTLWYWIESLLSWHPSTSANSVTINIPTRAHVMCNFFWAHQVGLQVFLVRPIKRTFPEPWNSKPHLTVKSVTKLSLKSQPWRNWTKATPMELRNQKKTTTTWGISLVLFHRKPLFLQNLLPKRSVYALFGSLENFVTIIIAKIV